MLDKWSQDGPTRLIPRHDNIQIHEQCFSKLPGGASTTAWYWCWESLSNTTQRKMTESHPRKSRKEAENQNVIRMQLIVEDGAPSPEGDAWKKRKNQMS